MTTTRWILGALLGGASAAVMAQSGSVAIYGAYDQYANYMHSSSGTTIKGTEDGAFLRSRLGFRGTEDLGDGLSAASCLRWASTA